MPCCFFDVTRPKTNWKIFANVSSDYEKIGQSQLKGPTQEVRISFISCTPQSHIDAGLKVAIRLGLCFTYFL